jgi:putative ABC transport system permease protein
VLERLFAALLVLLPRGVRRRYAAEMRQTFRVRLQAARAEGAGRVARTVAREYVDVVRAAVSRPDPELAATATERVASRRWLSGASLDVRFAWRTFVRRPSFTLAAIVTLALGIGANAAVFSVIHGVLLAPLPYPDADRLVALFHGTTASARGTHSPVTLRDYQARTRAFASLGVYDRASLVLTGRGDAERLESALVSEDFFGTLGVTPAHGRLLQPRDVRDAARSVVISDRLWRSRFGGQPVVGTTMALDGTVHEIVGVLAPGAGFPFGVDVWTPLVLSAEDLTPNQRGAHYVEAIARLQQGVTLAQARRDADRVSAALAAEMPKYHEGTMLALAPLRDALTEHVRDVLFLLVGAVALVLLVACANVANLLLSRASARHGEVALRTALGASRSRLARQFLAESLLLGLSGGLAGVLLAGWSLRPLLALAPAALPAFAEIGLHWPVVAFTFAVSLVSGLAFGVLPALVAIGRHPAPAIRDSGGRGTVGTGRGRLGRALAIAEVAVALVLMTGAVLLIRSVANLGRVETGFDPAGVVTFRLTLPQGQTAAPDATVARYSEILDAFARVPGVTATGLALGAPFSRSNPFTSFDLPGIPSETERQTAMRVVWGNYFDTLRIPLLQGRPFDSRDGPAAPLVAIVNQAFARAFLGGANPIGRTIRLHASLTRNAPRGPRTIVGVVGDVRQRRLSRDPEPDVFIPYGQHALADGLVMVRTAGAPADIVPALRARLAAIDGDLPISQVATMEDLIGVTIVQQRFTGTLLNIFAIVAALLAAVGLYGVLAFDVAQRTREIGVRMALGAERASVLRLFLKEGATVAVAGTLLGLMGTLALGHLIQTQLFGVRPTDPYMLASAAAGMLIVSAAASFVPARRATRLDPTVALRD